MAPNTHGISKALQNLALILSGDVPLAAKQTSLDCSSDDHALRGILADLAVLEAQDIEALLQTLEIHLSKKKLTDDRTMQMEHLITVASKLPETSANRARLTSMFTKEIWSSLDHPPPCSLGDLANYRQPDGSYNNLAFPDLGKANTPYARSVAPRKVVPTLPDPDVLFDAVMSRKNGGFKHHPNQVSSVLFYLAVLIIHDCFRTSREDPNISTTSSYLDLAPLYGSNQEEQDRMRTFIDGKLKPDCFSEKRLLGFPPGVACLVIMFNRFHNHVAANLAAINENGRFGNAGCEESVKKRDHDLFNTARLITCGLYVNIILHDYLRTILNLNRTASAWWIDPRTDIGDGTKSMGTGNQNSFEFNLMYRWHSAVSQRDEKWTEDLYEEIVGKE